jgi:acetyl-CoA C-acetyltransferase
VHFAAQAVMSGTADVVVAHGVQQMSQIPISSAMTTGREFGFEDPFSGSEGWQKRYGDVEVSQFASAERIAERWDCSREDMERFALSSHERAIRATDEGRFAGEIVPLAGLTEDETPRRGTSLEKMAGLPTLQEGGRLTAAVSSQIADASAALLLVSGRALEQHGLTPRARIHHLSVTGDDPVWMLTAPIPATRRALERAGQRSTTSTWSRSTRRSPRSCSPGCRRPARIRRRSTRTAARSRSATRSARPASG